MIKLPDPACTVNVYEVNSIFWEVGHEQSGCGSPLFTEAQMLQFRRDALEEAINTVLNFQAGWIPDGFTECADAIRKLKDET